MKTANHKRIIPARNEIPNGKHDEDWSPVHKFTASSEASRDFETQMSALELANRTKDAWLIAQSQKLREPMSSMASMLGLMELGHQLALVRPLHQMPSEFDEAAFKHLRRNFDRLVRFFNDLADLTGEGRLRIDPEERPIVKRFTPSNTELQSNNPTRRELTECAPARKSHPLG